MGEPLEPDGRTGVRSSLLRALVLLVLAMGGASVGVTLYTASRAVDGLSRALITSTADRVTAELDRFVAPAARGLRFARELAKAGLLPQDQPRRINAVLMPFLEDNPLVSSIEIAEADGREYMLRRAGGWQSREVGAGPARLRRWSNRDTVVEESRRNLDYDPRRRPWYEGAAALSEPNQVYWTRPYAFFTSHEPGITASTRWTDPDGSTRTAAFDVRLADVSAFTRSLVVSPSGRALVLDEEGRVVGLPRDPRFATPEAAAQAALSPVAQLGLPEVTRAFELWLGGAARAGDVFSFPGADDTWWAGFRRYELSPQRPLWIAVAVPQADLLGPLIAQRNRMLAVTGAALLVAVVLAFALDRLVQRRLARALRRARRVGRYTLEWEIGRGGMGTVYHARHAMLRRPTAVKVLRDAGDEHAIARFEREVQLTSELTHPNTIAVYDYGRTPDGTFYYAMEYLSGISLQALVQHFGPLPPERVIAILVQVCGSLGEAHARGLVHRDVKPGNVVLCERGGRHDVVKVLDFGLVKDLGGRDGLELTGAHAIPGSPLYLSPEAVKGPELVEARSDLYSLGATAYTLLCGEPVFSASNPWAVCMAHLKEEPRPPSARCDRPIPADLERVVMDCLAKEPADRPADAGALARRLEACADARGWSEERASAWWRDHASELDALRPAPERAGRAAARALEVDLVRGGGGSGASPQMPSP